MIFVFMLHTWVKQEALLVFFYQETTKLGERYPFLISAKHMFRFSYRVPSLKMTGLERNDDPIGSFELDPAF